MNYGLYLSASGALNSMHRQDVMANNLANVNTIGYKPDSVVAQSRLPERLEDPSLMADPKWLLERLGGGLHSRPTHISNKQGSLTKTESPLDVALTGDGFFVLEGDSGNDDLNVRLTRDGRFSRNGDGELVMASNGRRVLGTDNQPIILRPDVNVAIDERGGVSQSGDKVGQLRIASAPDDRLIKGGENTLRISKGTLDDAGITSIVHQGHVEESAVDPITTLNAMIGAAKTAQGNLTLMQYQDAAMGRAINTFGRVA